MSITVLWNLWTVQLGEFWDRAAGSNAPSFVSSTTDLHLASPHLTPTPCFSSFLQPTSNETDANEVSKNSSTMADRPPSVPLHLTSVAILGPDNAPLYVHAFTGPEDEMRAYHLAHAAVDVIEERSEYPPPSRERKQAGRAGYSFPCSSARHLEVLPRSSPCSACTPAPGRAMGKSKEGRGRRGRQGNPSS